MENGITGISARHRYYFPELAAAPSGPKSTSSNEA
jgi:hypothetical protein